MYNPICTENQFQGVRYDPRRQYTFHQKPVIEAHARNRWRRSTTVWRSTMLCGISAIRISVPGVRTSCSWVTKLIVSTNKTRLLCLWSDNALGKCWKNTREACKTPRLPLVFYTLFSYSPNISRVHALPHHKRTRLVFYFLHKLISWFHCLLQWLHLRRNMKHKPWNIRSRGGWVYLEWFELLWIWL